MRDPVWYEAEDQDSLEYGYVLSEGGWHIHFGKSDVEYQCELLNAQTNIFAGVQKFGVGGVLESRQFVLTLDGEGVEENMDLGLNCAWGSHWGNRLADPNLQEAGRRFQQEVVPLLYESPPFQQALAEVIGSQRYLCLVPSNKLKPAPMPGL